MMEPTTAMAEIALVMDMSGVCNNRETRRITPIPMNVASMNTMSMDQRSSDMRQALLSGAGLGQGLSGTGVFHFAAVRDDGEIGRASCRERGWVWVGAVVFK